MSYRNEFNNVQKESYWTFKRVFSFFLFAIVAISTTGYFLGWFSEAGEVAQDEFGPKAALEKYEWFIDQSNMIEKMDQDVVLWQNKIDSTKSMYKSYGEMKNWPLDVRVTYNKEISLEQDQLVAVKSQRNNLVREYNAASEKFNWAPFQTEPDKPDEVYYELK